VKTIKRRENLKPFSQAATHACPPEGHRDDEIANAREYAEKTYLIINNSYTQKVEK